MSSLSVRELRCVKSLLAVLPAVCAALAILAQACAARGAITLSQDYDSASLNVNSSSVSMANPLRPAITVVPRQGYFQFRTTGVNGLTPQFTHVNAAYMTNQHRYWYSYDNQNWNLFDNGVVSGGNFLFSNNTPFTQDTVYVAQILPFPTWRTDNLVASVKSSPYVFGTVSGDANFVIGRTPGTAGGGYYDDCGRVVPSLNLYGFKITDGSVTGPKVKVVLQTGNHPTEFTGTYVHEGLVLFLLSNDPRAAVLRQKAEFYIYPLVNPEGRYMGMGQNSPQVPSMNHNRMWNDPNYYGCTDIAIVERSMKADTGSAGVQYFFDFHSWTTAYQLEISIRSNVVGTTFITTMKSLEPSLSLPVYDNPAGYSDTWAVSAAGLGATYGLIPEFGLLAGVTVDGYHNYAKDYGQALYDSLKDQTPTNLAPLVNAGSNQTIHQPVMSVSLAGAISDDGLPTGAAVTSTWSVTSGPGNITFGDPSAAATTATFSTLGTYVLRLTASDTALSAFAEVQITVAPPPTNLAPVVSAGADQMISLPVTSVSLAGTVSDDGLPTGAAVTATWSPQSGPGTVLFANAAAAATTATFSTTGTYVLRLTASDTALSAFAECQVTLLPPGALHLLLHLTFDEGSGTTAADSSGFGRNGTLGGGATWVAGKMGTAVQFNEYSSNVIVPDFPLTSEFSVSFWFQENNHSATCEKEYLFSWGGPYTPNNVNVWLSNWTPTSCLLADAEDANDTWLGADALTLADTTLFNGQWHHYCLTTSAAYGVKEYVDGVLRTTSPTIGGGAIDPGTNLFIGCRSDLNASRFYGGAIDDVRIYDSALAPSDVLALYSGTPANTAPTASAGPDCKVMIPNALTLAGTISDDGQPAPPAACTAAWSVVLGPGAVTFGSPSAAITTATFSTAGTYVLMLTANDSALTGASTVTVTALAPGDFNGDGKVDGVDFLIWQSHYPRSSGGTPDGGDANGDGKVDGVDFLVWQTNYHS